MADDEVTPEETPEKVAGVKIEGHASIVALIIAALVTAILTFLLGMAKRKAAIERAKRLIAEEKLEQVKETAKLSQNQKVRDEAAKKILKLQADVDSSVERIEELDEKHKKYVKELTAVNSWDDLFKE